MTFSNINLTCPICGKEFESREIASFYQEGADLDTRPRGLMRRALITDSYHRCPSCNCVFIDEQEVLNMDKDYYNELLTQVNNEYSDDVKAWSILLAYSTYTLAIVDTSITVQKFLEMCLDKVARLNNLIWALDDENIDAIVERQEKIQWLRSILTVQLPTDFELFEDLQIMLMEEYRRIGEFNMVLNFYANIEDPFKQKVVEFEKYLARNEDNSIHTLDEIEYEK